MRVTIRALAAGLFGTVCMAAFSQESEPRSLAPVLVTAPVASNRPGALRDDIVTTESISAKAMAQSGATNLPELLIRRPGVDVQVECSVCNTRNITLNNLPGRFTTLLVDGVPIFSSVSNAYGLDMIGVSGLERVDISRGAGTSLIAPESLAGTVNLVTRRPTRDGADLDLSLGSFGLARESVDASKLLSGGALSLTATHQRQNSVDGIGIGLSQSTGFNRNAAGLGLFLDDLGGFRLKARFDHLEEKRMGGPLGSDYDAVIADQSGNPFDFSRGPHAAPLPGGWINPSTGAFVGPYEDGRFGLAQIIFTNRDQFVSTAEKKWGEGRVRLAFGWAQHQQDSWYGGDADYFGRQRQYYLETSYQQALGNSIATLGLNYRYEDLHSSSYSPNTSPLPAPQVDADAYVYRTPGIFAQLYRPFFDERLELNASLRYDHNNVYGGLWTPRLNLLWHHSDELSSRLAAGTGYRLPTSFFELDHAVLQASGVDRSQARAERSQNLSYAFNHAGDRLDFTATLNHTRIANMALFVPDPVNAAGLLLQPASSAYTINNADIQGTLQVTARDAVTLGLEHYQYRFNPTDFQGSLFARPDTRFTAALDHTQGPWNFNIKATWTGPQDLAAFYDYADNPRYNLDGTPKPDRSPSFWVVDAHANWQLSRTVSAYLTVSNLFNFQQATKDSYLWLDASGALDVTHVWGPNLGRALSLGVRVSL